MSRLFEALQMSESERTGAPFSNLPGNAPELLQAAEQGSEQIDGFPSVQVSTLPHSRLISLTDKESLGSEKFRFLGVRLRQLQQGRTLKKVLITSTIAEEGKSLISANLAITLARRQQQKVLLIEGDLRRPVLAPEFGLGTLPGMCELLKDESGPLKNVYYLNEAKMWFIPAGEPPENPLELMQSGRLQSVLQQLGNLFDWIIIDSPPILPLADTTVWSKLADGVLLVAREGKTEKGALRRGVEALRRATLLGVVLNSCTNTDHSNYYQRYSPAAYSKVAASEPTKN